MTQLEFPARVWYQTANGRWASRKRTMADTLERKKKQASWPKEPASKRK